MCHKRGVDEYPSLMAQQEYQFIGGLRGLILQHRKLQKGAVFAPLGAHLC